jgi:hypothetical protein
MDLGWLGVLVLTFAVPLTLDAYDALTYFTSLLIWLIPIVYLWPLFRTITAEGTGRRRRALRVSIAAIVGLGTVLDFLLGHFILTFPGCAAESVAQPYVLCLPAVGGSIPIEELLFYALGPVVMVLLYACADERWLKLYNPEDELLNVKLLQVSPRLVLAGVGVIVACVVVWQMTGSFPLYALFLGASALLPTMFLYRSIGRLINWPALAVTAMFILLASIIWEVTLAVPRAWWGYEADGMLGIIIRAWSAGDAIFPVEAAFVWIVAPLFTVFTYEFAKAFFHHPGSTRAALFGRR